VVSGAWNITRIGEGKTAVLKRTAADLLSSLAMEDSLSQASQIQPGGHDLRREVVVHHQRRRILAAVVELVAEQGYRATTVTAIIKRAGVAKLKFYELFDSKQDAFLAALDDGVAEAGERVAAATTAAADGFADRADAGIAALLAFCAERPALARAAILEAPKLGTEAGDRRAAALAAFAPLLAGARESGGGQELPEGLEQTTLDGLYWLLYEALLSGKPKRIEKLRPALVEFALLQFLGPVEAARATAS
jgi:AcrR family transcriptional regulator